MSPPGPVVLSRADWGADPVVRSSDGTPRSPVQIPARWLTVHYTGNATALHTADRAAVIAAQQGLERYAAGAGKPNEYNWCLYADATGAGYIVEYAGRYQAAHSAGENAQAVGVLFWVGVDQLVSDAMVTAYRYLRDVILAGGTIGPATAQTPHRDMPDAATPCPGPVLDRWTDLLDPYQEAPVMAGRILVRNGDHPSDPADKNWHAWVVFDAGKFYVKTEAALTILRAELGTEVDVDDQWMIAHGPVVGPNPTNSIYGCWSG